MSPFGGRMVAVWETGGVNVIVGAVGRNDQEAGIIPLGMPGPLGGLDSAELFDAFCEADDAADWQERALCAETDPESFFPEKGGSTREAKRICSGCEVRAECLEYALTHDERFGIWGGLSERERRRLKKAAG